MKIFAHKPCEAYAKMKSDEFVTRFLPLLKAEKENIPMYHYYVSLLVSCKVSINMAGIEKLMYTAKVLQRGALQQE